MSDFDSCLNEACESVLSEVFGSRGVTSTSWWLAREGVNFSDCSLRPQEFDDALVELLQPMGALIVEDRILARFCKTTGIRYHGRNSLNFADEIRSARRLFEKAQK